MSGFEIKDSGERAEFEGGMVRDTAEGKLDWNNLRIGPMPRRIVAHLTKGREKYPDPAPGIPNWTLGRGLAVWLRARESLQRHIDAYLAGKTDEDHAAGMYFNTNIAEFYRLFFTPEEEAQARAVEALQAEPGPELLYDDRTLCTCTIACIPQGITDEQTCKEEASARGPSAPEARLPLEPSLMGRTFTEIPMVNRRDP